MKSMMLQFYRNLPLFKGKLRLGKLLFKNLINKDTPVSFTAHNKIKYKIPNTVESLGVELFLTGMYEQDVVQFLESNIRDGDIYFDIGANIGAVGIPVVKNKQGVKYFGFEASPMVFDYLTYNFSNNNIADYKLQNNIVHEDDKQSIKFYQSDQYGKSSLAPTYATEYIFINSVSIDSFCDAQQVTHINWMKIDVQGFELYVFKGLQQLLLNKKVDNILFEFEYWAEEQAGLEIGTAQRYILGLGYELFDMNGKKLTSVLTEGSTMIWARPIR